jgi:lipoyl(octanoyl) transferase
VYTLGRRSEPDELPVDRDINVVETERGGKLTYHGPGQLVGYPILDLGPRPDAARYLRRLEEVVIRACADLGLTVHRRPDVQTGLWVGDDKVSAIGVRLLRARITLHGFAVNCAPDLSWFDGIVACGLPRNGVTSLTQLAGRVVGVEDLRPPLLHHLGKVFGLRFTDAPDHTFAAPVGA